MICCDSNNCDLFSWIKKMKYKLLIWAWQSGAQSSLVLSLSSPWYWDSQSVAARTWESSYFLSSPHWVWGASVQISGLSGRTSWRWPTWGELWWSQTNRCSKHFLQRSCGCDERERSQWGPGHDWPQIFPHEWGGRWCVRSFILFKADV